MEELETVNQRIKYAMEQEGHTVSSLARKCHRPDNTIRSVIGKERNLRVDVLEDIIKAFDGKYDANFFVMGQLSKPMLDADKDIKKLHAIIDRLTRQNEQLTNRLLELTQPESNKTVPGDTAIPKVM
jgi:plasmid maintenance system antidote protein VapI